MKIIKEDKKSFLNFAKSYRDFEDNPGEFEPRSLIASAENLNAILNPIVTAINLDVEELFIAPTLAKIQQIVSECDAVEYAEVGKTHISGLNGITSSVLSETVSTFRENPPLRLNELLEEAGRLNQFSEDLLPTPAVPTPGVPTPNAIPVFFCCQFNFCAE